MASKRERLPAEADLKEVIRDPFAPNTVILIDDDPDFVAAMEDILKQYGYKYTSVTSTEELQAFTKQHVFGRVGDFVILDLIWGGKAVGLDVLEEIRRQSPDLPVIILTGYDEPEFWIESIARGAVFYLKKPAAGELIRQKLEEAKYVANLKPFERIRAVQERLARSQEFISETSLKTKSGRRLVGIHSQAMHELIETVGYLAKTDTPIIITGEPGTGKELVAEVIHNHSERRGQSFVVVSVAEIPATLFESHLFGIAAKGSFTGSEKMLGYYERASGGTLVLDEIGEIGTELQVKLLRPTDKGEISRVGVTLPLKTNVRLIAITNINLEHSLENELFRKDLFFRLKGMHIHVPSLADRSEEDFEELTAYFLNEIGTEVGRPAGISKEAYEKLFSFASWNGNVRELRQVIRSAYVLSQGRVIGPSSVERAKYTF